MKIKLLFLPLFCLVFLGCEKEEVNRIDPSKSLSIEVSIDTRIAVNSNNNVVETFKESDRIGLYITASSGDRNNIPACMTSN